MLVVVALGRNALLRGGAPAVDAVAELAREHDVVVTHGNGPHPAVVPYPLDVLEAETEGTVGYLLDQALVNRLSGTRQVATLLTQMIVDPADPAFARPETFIGPVYEDDVAHRLSREARSASAREIHIHDRYGRVHRLRCEEVS